MNQFEALYLSTPSAEDIQKIKAFLSRGTVSYSWKDYYWCAKILCKFDAENFDADSVVKALNNSTRLGLTFRANKELYLDAIKILAMINSQLGRYDIAKDNLASVLELDNNAPDWICHAFVSAQIRTDDICIILQNPVHFLSYLNRNDSNDDATAEKQKRIFEDFLATAVRYLSNHPEQIVNFSRLREEASAFGLLNSRGWIVFEKMWAKNYSGQCSFPEFTIPDEQNTNDFADTEPLIVSLFPEDNTPQADHNSAFEKEHAELLAELDKTRRSLEQTRQVLEEQKADLEVLRRERESLICSVTESSAEQQCLQEKISRISTENETLLTKVKELEEQQTSQLKSFQNDITADIISHMHIYLHTVQLKLVAWLEHYLPKCSNSWWENCVIDSLTYEQRERAYEQHFMSLNQFDLAALLRIMKNNWYNFTCFMYLNNSDKDKLQEIVDVRNRWAHMDSNLPDAETIKNDLHSIAEFMGLLHCSRETISEVCEYTRFVSKKLS